MKTALGTIADSGYNLDSGASCGFSAANNSQPSTDPLLADQPAFNGGPTQIIALLEGSPAINAIPTALTAVAPRSRPTSGE